MSNPLELAVYPIWDAGDGTLYADHPTRQWPTNVGYEVYRKRLTDTELAAEYWRARWVTSLSFATKARRSFCDYQQTRTLERFATHPHYDEADQ